MKELKNIKNILFDCDGVLYQDLEAVFGQVSKRMTNYISKKLNLDIKKAKDLNAFIHFDEENIINQVEKLQSIDKKLTLKGIPIAIKDNINLKNHETTCSSKILSNYVSPYDATVITKLRKYLLKPIDQSISFVLKNILVPMSCQFQRFLYIFL